jgi:signal transduction histidine kinase
MGDAGVELSRVIREALTNARRHSGAKSVTVTLGTEGGELVAEVSDDGRGFGPEAESGGGSRSMRERTAALGGELRIESEPEHGTRVLLRVPLPREARK